MAAMSGVFWVTSWPPALLTTSDKDFPNCVSARYDFGGFGWGSLSHRRLSCLFVSFEEMHYGVTGWSERANGHFCGFSVPPMQVLDGPKGFNLHLGPDALGWNCPYWWMATIWIVFFVATRRRIQFQTVDLLWITGLLAVLFAAIRLRIALIPILWLNISTLVLLVLVFIAAARALWQHENLLWPLVIPDDKRPMV